MTLKLAASISSRLTHHLNFIIPFELLVLTNKEQIEDINPRALHEPL